MVKLYLAGPDVFRPNAREIGEQMVAICKTYNCVGLFPLFASDAGRATNELAADIARINTSIIRLDAHAVVANISPFRGPHADDGTAKEIGLAEGIGKPVFLYSTDRRPLIERIRARPADEHRPEPVARDINGDEIENFGLPANLMLTPSPATPVYGCAEEAIREAAIALGAWSRP